MKLKGLSNIIFELFNDVFSKEKIPLHHAYTAPSILQPSAYIVFGSGTPIEVQNSKYQEMECKIFVFRNGFKQHSSYAIELSGKMAKALREAETGEYLLLQPDNPFHVAGANVSTDSNFAILTISFYYYNPYLIPLK